MLAVTRHSWASYWLRNVCHGLETYPVYTRSVPQAMFISEILSRITHHRLDIDIMICMGEESEALLPFCQLPSLRAEC